MNRITITEIRNYLNRSGAALKKLKMRLNGSDAYKVQYKDGGFHIFTVHQLKEAFISGAL